VKVLFFIEWLYVWALDSGRPVFRRCKPPIFEPNPFFAYMVFQRVNIYLRCHCKAKFISGVIAKQSFFIQCLFNIPLHLTKLCIQKYMYHYSLFVASLFFVFSPWPHAGIPINPNTVLNSSNTDSPTVLPVHWTRVYHFLEKSVLSGLVFLFSMVKSSSSGIDLWYVMLAGLCSWYSD